MRADGFQSSSTNEEPLSSGRRSDPEERGTEPASGTNSGTTSRVPKWILSCGLWLKTKLDWIPENLTRSKIKTTIRCAFVGWVSAVLFVIPSVQAFLGEASFLILIAAFFSPPSDPFISVLEREALILLFVVIGWAWACLGIFIASLTRGVDTPNVTIFQVANGQYIEAAPSVILAVFLFLGSAFFLYIRARQGPGPYLSASVFGCLCVDICFTLAVLFPYPLYLVGLSIILPLACHIALSLLASIFMFPSTVSALFTSRLAETISPLLTGLRLHEQLLSMSLSDPAYNDTLNEIRNESKKCESNLVPLAAAGRLLGGDLTYSRFAPADFRAFQATCGKLAARADGMSTYFALIDPNRERFLGTLDKSMNETPIPTSPPTPKRRISKGASPDPSNGDTDRSRYPPSSSLHSISGISHPPTASTTSTKGYSASHSHPHTHSRRISPWNPFSTTHRHADLPEKHPHHHLHSDLLHHSLLSPAKTRRQEHAVGVFETQKYLNFEITRFHDPDESLYTGKLNDLMNECSTSLLAATHSGLSVVSEWFDNVRVGRISHIRDSAIISILGSRLGKRAMNSEDARKVSHREQIANIKRIKEELATTLQVFRAETRHVVLEPYRSGFDKTTVTDFAMEPTVSTFIGEQQNEDKDGPTQLETKAPPHRYLFHCYIYQYHLIFLAGDVIEMLDEILRLEEERPWPKCSLWTPVANVFRWNSTLIPEQLEQLADDDDPDVIQGLEAERDKSSIPSSEDTQSTLQTDLGIPHRRDPDALPPRNFLESFFHMLYGLFHGVGGNVVFAIKAGLLTVVLTLPILLKGSAGFAYENRFVWAIFMGQLTLARFRGDTIFALIARLISTFVGGIVGLVMWYISAGSGAGNPYGFAAVCAVCFPFFFYARLYWPISPMINLILFATVILIIGYSYQDSLIQLPGSPGAGFTVAWRRFVLVSIGVFAAFIASLLPPSTTIRKYQRSLLSTTSAQLGSIYCSILSYANTKNEPEIQEILSSLVALRNKLKKSTELRANVGYEFSLRGRWPTDRYQKITDLQIGIAYSLSHLISVIKHLEPSWALAFLRRARFLDPDFQGDLLAVLSMISSSLRTGCPLPQITPCPLVDRFTLKYHGLNVIHKDSEEDYGLPRTLTLDVLKNEQYLMFCVGISTAFDIVNRLDRLMMAVKEVVGEQYHIHGIGVPLRQSRSYLTPAISIKDLDGPREKGGDQYEVV